MNIILYNNQRWVVTDNKEMRGLDRANYLKLKDVPYNPVIVGELSPVNADEEFPVGLSCGYHLADMTKDPKYISFSSCMASPPGFANGHGNNRYVLSSYAFEEIFGFIEEWNKTFMSTSFIVRRKVGVAFSRPANWWSIILKKSDTPELYFVSIEIKNVWNSRHIAKLLAVFLRAFFYGEAAGNTLKSENETYIEYFLRAVNNEEGDSHYFNMYINRYILDKLDSLVKLPPYSYHDICSQTVLVNRILGVR